MAVNAIYHWNNFQIDVDDFHCRDFRLQEINLQQNSVNLQVLQNRYLLFDQSRSILGL